MCVNTPNKTEQISTNKKNTNLIAFKLVDFGVDRVEFAERCLEIGAVGVRRRRHFQQLTKQQRISTYCVRCVSFSMSKTLLLLTSTLKRHDEQRRQ
jgi:hypothetical protein